MIPTRTLRPHVSSARLAYKYQTFITIDRAHFTLRLWKNLHLARSYRIAVGRQGLETPAGLYEINDRQVNPSWHVPNSSWAGALAGRVIPPGPEDPIKSMPDQRQRLTGISQLPPHQHHQRKTEEQKDQATDAVLDSDDLVVGREDIFAPKT